MSAILLAPSQPQPSSPPPTYTSIIAEQEPAVRSQAYVQHANDAVKRPVYRRFLSSSKRVVLTRTSTTTSSTTVGSSSSSSSSSSQTLRKLFPISLLVTTATSADGTAAPDSMTNARARAATTTQLASLLRTSKQRLGALLIDTPSSRAATAEVVNVLSLQTCADTAGIAKPCRSCHQGERCSQLGSRPPRRRYKPVSEYTLAYSYTADDVATAATSDDDAEEAMLF